MGAIDNLAAYAASSYGALVAQIVGIIGFGITLRQLRKVRRIADAQRDAILGLQIRLGHLDIYSECTKAESALSEIRKSLLDNSGIISLRAIDPLATAFVTILEGSAPLPEDVQDRLKEAINELNRIGERNHKRQSGEMSSAKRLASIREYHGLITKIRALIQEDQRS